MKKLLIVVDYQNDFVTGSLGFPKAEKLEAQIAEKIRTYRQNGDEIAFTMDTHTNDYENTQEGKMLPVSHCIEGSPGWELYGEIKDLRLNTDACFYKPAFGSAELFEYLKDKQYDSVELAGLVSNICVISNAVLVKTALPNTPVYIDANAVGSNDSALHQKALDIMENLQCIILN